MPPHLSARPTAFDIGSQTDDNQPGFQAQPGARNDQPVWAKLWAAKCR